MCPCSWAKLSETGESEDKKKLLQRKSLKQSMEKMVMLLEFLTFDILDAADRVSLVREGGRVDGGLVII